VVTVNTKEYREALVLPALVKADRIAAIKTEFPGRLEKWHFKEGDLVEQGQLVVSLNIDTLMAGINELQASMKTAAENSDLAGIMIESAELDLENARMNKNVQALALEAVQSDHNLALTEFKRIQKLVKKKVLDPSKLDTVRNALRQTELGVARAKEGLSGAELSVTSGRLRVKQATAKQELAVARLMELDAAVANVLVKINKSSLRAPISGRLEEHLMEPGEVLPAGVSCANIYDLTYLRATVNVPDRFVAFLDSKNGAAKTFIQMNRPGVELQVRAKLIIPGLPTLGGGKEAGLELDAEIVYIAQSTDPESNTFKVELRLPNVGGALRHGIIGRAKIEYLFYPQAIVIPVPKGWPSPRMTRPRLSQRLNGG